MRLASIAAALMIISTPNSSWSADSYIPPVVKEASIPPQAFFGKVKRTGRWCAFDLTEWKARNAREEIDPEEFGWIRYSQGRLESITVGNQSADANTEDRYFFGSDARAIRMIRSGHYINAPWASFEYRPGKNGRLVLTAQGREVVRRLVADDQETYIVDWPRYPVFGSIPFAKLINLSNGVQVKLGCPSRRRHPDP